MAKWKIELYCVDVKKREFLLPLGRNFLRKCFRKCIQRSLWNSVLNPTRNILFLPEGLRIILYIHEGCFGRGISHFI